MLVADAIEDMAEKGLVERTPELVKACGALRTEPVAVSVDCALRMAGLGGEERLRERVTGGGIAGRDARRAV